MLWYVYVLYSPSSRRFYTGMTKDLERRIQEHNTGKTKSTKGFRPWKLVYSEVAEDRVSARNRESFLKSGIGREWIRKRLNEAS
ncbi:MAG: GIY-YIG nuclease family protein [Lewinellaceae bacterium]|nr:GIY-YIG nuclease family protein [Saprospiraceae bacterium]MCB9311690.1 GIY-YIG nuclease family protein [Lewinellaceae bacterium]